MPPLKSSPKHYESLAPPILRKEQSTFFGVSVSIVFSLFDIRLVEGIHTECPRRNVPDVGRVFLMLKYTDITQNTYVQS
jgi:hypothetical protein